MENEFCGGCKEVHENCQCFGFSVILSYDGFDFAVGIMNCYDDNGSFHVNIDGISRHYYTHTVKLRREDNE